MGKREKRIGKKLISVWKWQLEKAEYCSDCILLQKQTGIREDCSLCEYCPPTLLSENQVFWIFFAQVARYWARDMMGARIHLDWNVIRSIAEMSKYEFEPGDILKLQKYESLVKEHDQKKKVG